jgi:hypothetical protein
VLLAKAVKAWTGSGTLTSERTVGGHLNLYDLDFWLQQARRDPSFSREIAARWAETLEEHIRHTTTRFDAATLFGKLFNEWLASGDSVVVSMYGEGVIRKYGSLKAVHPDLIPVGMVELFRTSRMKLDQ